MSFVENLKSHLLRLRRNVDVHPPREPMTMDPAWVRAEFIHLFERWEREASSSLPPAEIERKFNAWMRADRVVQFAATLADLLQESFLLHGSREEVERYVRLSLAQQLGLAEPAPTHARQLELERLSARALLLVPELAPRDAWTSVAEYAVEIRAVRRSGSRLELTPIGNVFLSLSGRDAIQWLLSVEMAQSTGPADDWRLSRETVAALRAQPQGDFIDVIVISPHSRSTLRRLRAMGLLLLTENDRGLIEGYEVTDSGSKALHALASSGDTPISLLAATLSQDEALAALDDATGRSLPDVGLTVSAQATARQARLVVHEIRNALIPAQFALNSLYESLVGSAVEAEIARFRPRIDPGISRVLKFVNDLLKTSELATRPPEAFNLVRAVQDAQVARTTSLDIQFSGPSELPPVLGYRERFVLAIVNLLRNAEQAGARHVMLDLNLEEGGQDILLTVDDDGSGVPEEQRERIFQRGVSLRPGGAGEGLALVKEVVEFELRGKIACVEKPGGGARFRMRVPLAERSAR